VIDSSHPRRGEGLRAALREDPAMPAVLATALITLASDLNQAAGPCPGRRPAGTRQGPPREGQAPKHPVRGCARTRTTFCPDSTAHRGATSTADDGRTSGIA
jgi:hypothetical protein